MDKVITPLLQKAQGLFGGVGWVVVARQAVVDLLLESRGEGLAGHGPGGQDAGLVGFDQFGRGDGIALDAIALSTGREKVPKVVIARLGKRQDMVDDDLTPLDPPSAPQA